MNQLEYIPGQGGQSIQLDGPRAFVGTAENLRGREWQYELGYRDLMNANRPAREVTVSFWTDPETANDFRRAADADMAAKTPGTFVAQGEWKQRGYVLAANPRSINYDALEIELKIALMDGAWWRFESQSFYPEETPATEYASATGETVITAGAADAPLHELTVYGKSAQSGTPTPSSQIPIVSVEPVSGDSIYIDVDGEQTATDLQGYVIAALPNGTKDELTIDSTGAVTLTKRVMVLSVASSSWVLRSDNRYRLTLSNAAANSVGTNIYSDSYAVVVSASDMQADGIGIITAGSYAFLGVGSTLVNSVLMYELATPQTISLGSVTLPDVTNYSQVSISAAATPTITAEWQTSPDVYLDYPYDFPHDFAEIKASKVETSVLMPSEVRIVVYGPVVNPYVIVGGNKYQVNVTVPSGGYLTVDGRDKTIVLTAADGTTQNAFSYGVRGDGLGGGTYIFEPVQPGVQEVTYSGAFGFDFGWYEEEGEPPWKSY